MVEQIRRKPCECDFPEFCDWDREGQMAVPKTEVQALSLEENYVANVYESIAGHFNETRHSNWKAVQVSLFS